MIEYYALLNGDLLLQISTLRWNHYARSGQDFWSGFWL